MPLDHFNVVTIQTKPGLLLGVTNTRQVAELLTGNWPAQFRGKAYLAAVEASMDHVEGKKSGEQVRAAFIEAAKEARLLVSEGWPGA